MTPLDTLSLRQLRTLLVILEEGHISRAATRLGVAQPALSRTLRAVREAVGDPLLIPGPGGLVRTPRADALVEPLRRHLLDLERTLGGTTFEKGKRHPTIGDRVTIGAGAKVLGSLEVGEGSRIGANAVVVRSVPPNSVVVGVPGQIVSRSRTTAPVPEPDLDDTVLPDLVGASLSSLLDRVDELETAVSGRRSTTAIRPSAEGVWSGGDFSI